MKFPNLKHPQTRPYHQSKSNSSSIPLLEQFYQSSPSSNESNSNQQLTHQELNKINLLIPRLCLSGHLTTAIHLTTTSLFTNPPPLPNSISFSILIHFLASQTDMSKSMSLLTILKHTPKPHPYLTSVATMLIASYIKHKRPKEAFKVYQWMLRPGSPCRSVEKVCYEVLVNGFCGFGLKVEALRVLRDMVSVCFVPSDGVRRKVFRSLLRDARVNEALSLYYGLGAYANGGGVEVLQELLDSVIRSWNE